MQVSVSISHHVNRTTPAERAIGGGAAWRCPFRCWPALDAGLGWHYVFHLALVDFHRDMDHFLIYGQLLAHALRAEARVESKRSEPFDFPKRF